MGLLDKAEDEIETEVENNAVASLTVGLVVLG
jgi:hypothetical protein